MARAFVFPGQGSQAVGMGRELAATYASARETFEEIDDALSQHLSRLMAEGPEDELTLTANAQPALMAVSLAVVRVVEEQGRLRLADHGAFMAGHSLGEYSALAAAGSLDVATTARLLRTRGQAMQDAVPVGQGAMAALMGLNLDTVRDIAEQAADQGVCEPANDNAPGQVVVSGDTAAVERAVTLAKERGAKRAVMLPVSAPFHCRLMTPAAETMERALADTPIAAPSLPVVSNVTAQPETEPEAIRERLVEQVTRTVRWRESVQTMQARDVDTLVEVGHGTTLSGLARRIDRSLASQAVGGPEQIDALLERLS
ncbi:[acyl-carrier-protein] S-malonyltransferase [Limimonas halophila]|uniref:Malonyl CoA-acyl carrier protein transacylase n=1 Tax=Limimonas halophila TaxID=1082479 RepID=A0A1G7MGA5_9PROT|nr:ACP S-malonyltransferase [Limimonas halophila]SDF60169.1 [acyl-carrier-protein] S-malonyltransferase [Limimonas halophila]